MKVKVQESKPYPVDSEEYKQHKFYQYTILFEGDVDALQFRTYDTNIAMPNFIRQNDDGTIVVIYSYPSNIQCELDKDGTLWSKPAISQKELEALKEQRVKEQVARQENLSAITESH